MVPSIFKLTAVDAYVKRCTDIVCDNRYSNSSMPAGDLDSFVASPQLQDAYQECGKHGISTEHVNAQFIDVATSECARLGKLTPPISLETNITKFSDHYNIRGGSLPLCCRWCLV